MERKGKRGRKGAKAQIDRWGTGSEGDSGERAGREPDIHNKDKTYSRGEVKGVGRGGKECGIGTCLISKGKVGSRMLHRERARQLYREREEEGRGRKCCGVLMRFNGATIVELCYLTLTLKCAPVKPKIGEEGGTQRPSGE
jgi:hypothetical protein